MKESQNECKWNQNEEKSDIATQPCTKEKLLIDH